jgi:hypothetical protein
MQSYNLWNHREAAAASPRRDAVPGTSVAFMRPVYTDVCQRSHYHHLSRGRSFRLANMTQQHCRKDQLHCDISSVSKFVEICCILCAAAGKHVIMQPCDLTPGFLGWRCTCGKRFNFKDLLSDLKNN